MRDLKKIPVLVLNASYEPITLFTAKRALTVVHKGIAVVEKTRDFSIHTAHIDIPVPYVIRLIDYRRIPRRTRSVSRKSIMARDNHQCQYCLDNPAHEKLTLDHITPRAQGGMSTWENLVACCFKCNNLKGNRTPEEAGMPLTNRPMPFSIHTNRHLMRESGRDHKVWEPYLFYANTTVQETPVQLTSRVQ